jgi:hypothetical protein
MRLNPPPPLLRIKLAVDGGSSNGLKTGKNTLFTDKNARFAGKTKLTRHKADKLSLPHFTQYDGVETAYCAVRTENGGRKECRKLRRAR